MKYFVIILMRNYIPMLLLALNSYSNKIKQIFILEKLGILNEL